jgi:hypothetical protein
VKKDFNGLMIKRRIHTIERTVQEQMVLVESVKTESKAILK